MSIDQWWTKLQPATRTWLINNNGDEVPAAVAAEIAGAGGPATDDPWWSGQGETPGHYFPDDAIDWVEDTANDEESG